MKDEIMFILNVTLCLVGGYLLMSGNSIGVFVLLAEIGVSVISMIICGW